MEKLITFVSFATFLFEQFVGVSSDYAKLLQNLRKQPVSTLVLTLLILVISKTSCDAYFTYLFNYLSITIFVARYLISDLNQKRSAVSYLLWGVSNRSNIVSIIHAAAQTSATMVF